MSEDITIEVLEEFFKTTTLPKTIQINRGVKIANVELFVRSHLKILKERGKEYGAYYDHLVELRQLIMSK